MPFDCCSYFLIFASQPYVFTISLINLLFTVFYFYFFFFYRSFRSQMYIHSFIYLSLLHFNRFCSLPIHPMTSVPTGVPHDSLWRAWATRATTTISLLQQIHGVLTLFRKSSLGTSDFWIWVSTKSVLVGLHTHRLKGDLSTVVNISLSLSSSL